MNKNILSNAIMFAAGAAIGSVVTWRLLKTKYENLVQEEIESIRQVYSGPQDSSEVDEESGEDEEDRREYEKIVSRSGYNNNDEEDDDEEEGEEMIVPYVIVPEEFDENGYDTATLRYYADGVLAYDDTNEVVEDVEDLVCEDFADHFDEYEPDSVYVRNDNLRMDFEILRDQDPYSEGN